MAQLYEYPRLGRADAVRKLAELTTETHARIGSRATYANAGGRRVPVQALEQVRSAALAAVAARWPLGRPVPRGQAAAWDSAIGRALYEKMDILPSDAASEEVWSFLTLMVLPDLAQQRFPGCHTARILGTPRNTFRRTWWRQYVLGELMQPGSVPPLGEDELVNIFERTHLSRNHRLARGLAEFILRHRGPNRSDFARDFTRVARRETGPVLLDALTGEELQDVLNKCAMETGFRGDRSSRTAMSAAARSLQSEPAVPTRLLSLSVPETGLIARARAAEGQFVVLRGSLADLEDNVHDHWTARLRRSLMSLGVLAPTSDGRHLVFTRDQVFSDPGAARAVIVSTPTDVPHSWLPDE